MIMKVVIQNSFNADRLNMNKSNRPIVLKSKWWFLKNGHTSDLMEGGKMTSNIHFHPICIPEWEYFFANKMVQTQCGSWFHDHFSHFIWRLVTVDVKLYSNICFISDFTTITQRVKRRCGTDPRTATSFLWPSFKLSNKTLNQDLTRINKLHQGGMQWWSA